MRLSRRNVPPPASEDLSVCLGYTSTVKQLGKKIQKLTKKIASAGSPEAGFWALLVGCPPTASRPMTRPPGPSHPSPSLLFLCTGHFFRSSLSPQRGVCSLPGRNRRAVPRACPNPPTAGPRAPTSGSALNSFAYPPPPEYNVGQLVLSGSICKVRLSLDHAVWPGLAGPCLLNWEFRHRSPAVPLLRGWAGEI